MHANVLLEFVLTYITKVNEDRDKADMLEAKLNEE